MKSSPKLLFTTGTNPNIEGALVRGGRFHCGKIEWRRFADGEWYLRIREQVRGTQPIVLASTLPPADNIIRLLLLLGALRENGAKPAELWIPYFGYARQDRPTRPGEGNTARLMMELLTSKKLVKRLVVLDIHSSRILRHGRALIKNIDTTLLFAKALKRNFTIRANGKMVVVAPDAGAVARARRLARFLNAQVAWCEKYRPRPNHAVIKLCAGADVKGKTIILIDDIIDTGGTLIKTAEHLYELGAREIVAVATHGLFSRNALPKLKRAGIKRIFVTDTVEHKKLPAWVTTISAARLFSKF